MKASKISQLIDINNEQDLINELYTLVDEFYGSHAVLDVSTYEFFNWLVKDLIGEDDYVINKLKRDGKVL